MATPTPEAKKRGAVAWLAAAPCCFSRAHCVEETFSSSGVAKYQDLGSGRVLRNRLKQERQIFAPICE